MLHRRQATATSVVEIKRCLTENSPSPCQIAGSDDVGLLALGRLAPFALMSSLASLMACDPSIARFDTTPENLCGCTSVVASWDATGAAATLEQRSIYGSSPPSVTAVDLKSTKTITVCETSNLVLTVNSGDRVETRLKRIEVIGTGGVFRTLNANARCPPSGGAPNWETVGLNSRGVWSSHFAVAGVSNLTTDGRVLGLLVSSGGTTASIGPMVTTAAFDGVGGLDPWTLRPSPSLLPQCPGPSTSGGEQVDLPSLSIRVHLVCK